MHDLIMGEYVRVFRGETDLGQGIYMGEISPSQEVKNRASKILSPEEVTRLKVPAIQLLSGKRIYIFDAEDDAGMWFEPLGDISTTRH
jgi:hypothetical protein